MQPAGKMKSEMGSGLYLTTSYETAKKYAKGGGTVLRFFLDPDLTFANNSRVSFEAASTFIDGIPRLRHKAEIQGDLQRAADRVGGDPFAYMLENLMHNHGALTGEKGPMLARFLVEQGIDASLVPHGDEDWLVLYNLDKILSYEKVPKKEVVWDLPRIRRPT